MKFILLVLFTHLLLGCSKPGWVDNSPILSHQRFFQELVDNPNTLWDGFDEHPTILAKTPGNIAVKLVDINRDGYLDIMVDYDYYYQGSTYTNGSGITYFFLNQGGGNFSEQIEFTKTFKKEAISDIADVTGNGHLDLISYDWGNRILVYEGQGNMQFTRLGIYGTSTHGAETYALDFTGDGWYDIVSGASGSLAPFIFHTFENFPANRVQKHRKVNIFDVEGGIYHSDFFPIQNRGYTFFVLTHIQGTNVNIFNGTGTGDLYTQVEGYGNKTYEEACDDRGTYTEEGRLIYYGGAPHLFFKGSDIFFATVGVDDILFATVRPETRELIYSGKRPHGIPRTADEANDDDGSGVPRNLGSSLRDINRDGHPDIIMGIKGATGNRFFYKLADSSGGYENSEEVDIETNMGDEWHVFSHVNYAFGDLNGNGFDDMVVIFSSNNNNLIGVNSEDNHPRIYYSKTR